MAKYRISEFAKLIGVSVYMLRRWDASGKLKAYKTPTNQRFYLHEQYEAYLKVCGIATDNSDAGEQ